MRYLYYLLITGLLTTGSTAFAQQGTRAKTSDKSAYEEKEKLALYPLTADSYTNVYIEWDEMQPFTIAIYDNKDILQTEWKEKSTRSYQKAVHLSSMPAGSYYIVVKGKNEVLKKDFIISRKEK
jgi:hypothetical protein